MVTDPSTIDSMLQWFYNRYGFSSDDLTQDPHDVLAHLVFGFAPTYKGEIYAAVPEMVLRHTILYDDVRDTFLERRPSLQEVEESLARIYNGFAKAALKRRYDPWNFEPESQTPFDCISNKRLLPLIEQIFDNQIDENLRDFAAALEYYQRLLVPPDKRLPPELFAYAEQHFGSMPPRDEEAVNGPIVDPEKMKRLFPQYAAGMEYFCGIIDKYYAREPFEDRYNRVVSKESRDLVAAHMVENEQEILTVFRDMEEKVEKTVSSLGDVKTLEPLSPERIEELYHLCVQVDDYIKQETGKYPHEMTLDEIRALPIELLVQIREEFPWPHFEEDQPSSVGGADDPKLVFACLIAKRGEYGG